ncbi:MAG: hypothetical protein ACLRIT_10365 [Blautia sp.]
MKKILVLSESHGNVNNMVTAVRNTHPDQIIHLGDCWVDERAAPAISDDHDGTGAGEL